VGGEAKDRCLKINRVWLNMSGIGEGRLVTSRTPTRAGKITKKELVARFMTHAVRGKLTSTFSKRKKKLILRPYPLRGDGRKKPTTLYRNGAVVPPRGGISYVKKKGKHRKLTITIQEQIRGRG